MVHERRRDTLIGPQLINPQRWWARTAFIASRSRVITHGEDVAGQPVIRGDLVSPLPHGTKND